MSAPSSISRDKSSVMQSFYASDYSSILGKRGRGSIHNSKTATPPAAKRPATHQTPETGDQSHQEFIPSRDVSSSASNPDGDRSEGSDSDGEVQLLTIANFSTAPEPFPPSSTPRSKQQQSTWDSSSLVRKQACVLHGRHIDRRHSFPSLSLPYGDDFTRVGAASERQDGHNITTCFPLAHRLGVPKVYRILCSGKGYKQHPTVFYEDDPGKAASTDQFRSSHLAGSQPVYQLRNYANQFRQSSFVVIKNRICKNQIALSSAQEGHNETMIILSDDLRQAIQKVATCPLGAKHGKNELLEMDAPYLFLYRHKDALQVYSQSAHAKLRAMVDAMLEYLDCNYTNEYTEAAELISQGMVTLRHLEKLYYPNQLLVNNTNLFKIPLEDRGVYVLYSWPTMTNGQMDIKIWNWDFTGYFCCRDIKHWAFRGPAQDETEPFAINELLFYPASLLSEDSIELFRKRGKAFWNLRLPNFVYHSENRSRKGGNYAKPGRYMIDCYTYQRLHGSSSSSLDSTLRNQKTDPWRVTIHGNPEKDEFLLMPASIPGYDFFEKEWVKLSVSNIEPIKWNKQAYEDLVLPETTKHLVKALVTIRASSIKTKSEHAGFDVISSKGNGLIMLFHGAPGTGKTLTAESVAEIAEMPLYPITCGNLGTEPDKVEEYLRVVFQLGQRWNCVLLLDEADVFLEERTLTDLQRNSLVSVFLRMLEYYEGILILTSNRVGTFDDAFRSRIHIALHYEDLKPRARKKIWSNFLSRLENTADGENVEAIRERLDELARHNLNGREIRNALSTARQLASHGREKMSWEHLELAIKTANDFGNYLLSVHGHSDRDWAREARTR